MIEEFGDEVPATVVVAPSGLFGLADTVTRVRATVELSRIQAYTMTALAAYLGATAHGGRVTHDTPGGSRWTITVGAVPGNAAS